MKSSKELLEKLKEQHDKHTVSVLVGAGFSKNAINTYPGWDELLRELIVDLYGKQIKERFKQHQAGLGPFLSEKDFTDNEIADIIRDVGYLKLVSKYIEDKGCREAIDVYIEEHLPYVEETGGLLKVANMPTLPFNVSNLGVHKELLLCKWKHIYTTNYDNLLELTNDLYGMDYRKVTVDYKLSELSEHRGIVKIHGSLVGDSLSNDFEFDNDKSRRYIISSEDYATYAEKHQAFSYQMKTGLLTGVFCLIGFSGNDPNFLAWLEWMKDVLDRDITGSKEDSIKVFLITIGQQQIEKSRQLFYQNHHIGVINLLDPDVLKLIGANPLSPDVKTAFSFMFRYLNDGTSVVINPSGKIITNTMSQYQRIWSSIDTNNVTGGEVAELRRLRKSIVMPTTANRQRMIIDGLYNKKEWTKQDAELFAIACMDCGIWYINFRNDEKTALINDVSEWQLLQQMGAVLHNDGQIVLLADNTDWTTYLEVARCRYRFEIKNIKETVNNWNAEGDLLLNKAATLVFADVARSSQIIDEFINTSQDIERRYYASVLGNILSVQFPLKYSYNEFRAAGITGFVECRDAILKTIKDSNKEEIKPYGSSGWSFVMTKREADVEEAFRFMELLFLTGFPIQYKGSSLINHQDWYEIFRRVFVYMPYAALYYSLQLTDQKILKRIGQDYAYLESLASITPDLLKKVLGLVVEDVKSINWSSCLLVAKELMCSVDENEWFDLMIAIFNKEVVPNASDLSRRDAVCQFIEDAAVYLKDVNKKSSFLELLLEKFDDNTYFYSDIIYSLLKSNDIELTQKQKELISGIVSRQPISKTYLLLAQLDYCAMLDADIKQRIIESIKEHPDEVEKASFEVLFSLTYISYGDEDVVGIIKRSILCKDIWCCGIIDRSASVPQYLALNKISKEIKWTTDEMQLIMENLQKNLQLLEGWNLYADGFLTREHTGILTDMKEFVEICLAETGLKEYEIVLKHINDVMIKSFGGSNVLEKIFDKEAEIGDELHVLARAVDNYGIDKYKVYVNAIIDRALLQCEHALTMVLAFVEYLVDKHKEVLDDESIVYRLNLMLEKYVDVNYQSLNLSVAVAYRSMHKVAEALNEKNLLEYQKKTYWLENEFVGRFAD